MPGAARPSIDEYVTFCEGLRAIARVDLLQYKRESMERRVRAYAERRGLPALDAFLAVLRSNSAEVDAFLERVAITVSQLWRTPQQWALVADEVLPELAGGDRLRIWSAGCATGAEAYTVAAICRETLGGRAEIHGTDVDRRMVDRARIGHFSAEDGRVAPPAVLARWFAAEPDGSWQAKRELRSMLHFEVADLLRMRPRSEAYDLVMCRNIVLHVPEAVRDELHSRLVAALRPGGQLMIGASERVADPEALGLEPTHPFTYRKRGPVS